jgi:hypothetical protein
MRDVQLENETGQILKPLNLTDGNDHEHFQSALNTVTVIRFEAVELSPDGIDFRPMPNGQPSPQEYFGHILRFISSPSQQVLRELTENIHAGKWSCLKIVKTDDLHTHFVFILVVCWMEDRVTAERVAGFIICLSVDHYATTKVELLEDKTEWRRVRLV